MPWRLCLHVYVCVRERVQLMYLLCELVIGVRNALSLGIVPISQDSYQCVHICDYAHTYTHILSSAYICTKCIIVSNLTGTFALQSSMKLSSIFPSIEVGVRPDSAQCSPPHVLQQHKGHVRLDDSTSCADLCCNSMLNYLYAMCQ